MALVIDVTVSKSETPDMKKKGKLTAGVMAGNREVFKNIKISSSLCNHRTVFHVCSFLVARVCGDKVYPSFYALDN